uniref:Uncharacterized protein n=1 Tax=Rhizophora mucronata TaxID=61149 RepID=A0A2P2QLH2_RHIMU
MGLLQILRKILVH